MNLLCIKWHLFTFFRAGSGSTSVYMKSSKICWEIYYVSVMTNWTFLLYGWKKQCSFSTWVYHFSSSHHLVVEQELLPVHCLRHTSVSNMNITHVYNIMHSDFALKCYHFLFLPWRLGGYNVLEMCHSHHTAYQWLHDDEPADNLFLVWLWHFSPLKIEWVYYYSVALFTTSSLHWWITTAI